MANLPSFRLHLCTLVRARGLLGRLYPGRSMRNLSDHEDAAARSAQDDHYYTWYHRTKIPEEGVRPALAGG